MPIKLTKMLSAKFPKFERYISIPLIMLFTIPPIFLIAFVGTVGAYIGLAMYAFIGGYAMFEVFNNMNMSKYSAIYLGLTISILFLLPWTHWNGISDYGIKEIVEWTGGSHPSLSNIFSVLFTWRTIIIFFAAILLPIIIDPNVRNSKSIGIDALIIVVVAFAIGFFAKAIWIINKLEWTWVFFFIFIAIIADTFGYFGGMLFGKKWFRGAKLAPKLSPKKTWAGFVVGFVATALFIGLAGWYMHIFKNTSSEIGILIVSVVIMPIISPIGDLLFSGIKRYLNIKDFSDLLPGHGGVADRIDAMSTVVFVFVVMFIIF